MSKWRDLAISAAVAVLMGAPVWAGAYGLGRAALPDEIAAWDRDVRPDGTGLPPGQGTVETGEAVFGEQCAVCHGDFAEGVGNWPSLSGGFDTLDSADPVKTVGSYWPYLSTVFDYVRRSKPYGNAQSLKVDEVYAVVAYLLYSNDLVADDFTLSQANFLHVTMPNADGFIADDRAKTEYPRFSEPPCMQDCRAPVTITKRASDLDLTPPPLVAGARAGSDILANGEKLYRKCKACHQVGAGARDRVGPALNGIVGARVGRVAGFPYSDAMKAAGRAGLVWTESELAGFLSKPKAHMPGTRMHFSGLKQQADVGALIAYLASFGG